MKHLYEYDDQEIQDLKKDLESVGHGPMKGWIVAIIPFDSDGNHVGTTYYAITANTIEEAYDMVAEDWIPEMEDPINSESWEDLLERITQMLDWEQGAKFLTAWEGLTCKRKDPAVEVIRSASPFDVIDMLNREFTNVQSIMSPNPGGNTE